MQLPDWVMKAFMPTMALTIITIVYVKIRAIYNQGRINELKRISLEGNQIKFKNDTDSLNNLVDEFNKEHGPGGEDSGNSSS